MDVNAVCRCGRDMSMEPQGEFLSLSCVCGAHKLVNIGVAKGKDTQPVPVITKSMTEEDTNSRQRDDRTK